MPIVTAGIFQLNYTLRTNATAVTDIQFGMDFTVNQIGSALPLSQLIFPTTSIGTNLAYAWNVDNHEPISNAPSCLVFPNAMGGTITDTPTEIVRHGTGIRRTRFCVYRVDVTNNMVQTNGITFGYEIDTTYPVPATVFTGLNTSVLTNEERAIMQQKCPTVRFT